MNIYVYKMCLEPFCVCVCAYKSRNGADTACKHLHLCVPVSANTHAELSQVNGCVFFVPVRMSASVSI